MKYRVDFENIEGFFYVEMPSQNKLVIYDENKNFMSQMSYGIMFDDIETDIEKMSKYKHIGDFLDWIYDSYDCGETPQEVLKEYMYDITECCDYDYIVSHDSLYYEVREILFDCEFMSDVEFCKKWEICKIGGVYVKSRD